MARLGLHLASSVGSAFLDLDSGPESTPLRRELKWLLEHTVQEPENVDNNGGSVRLRVEIEELYMLWKQRVEERRPFHYICCWVRALEGLCVGLWADLGTGSGAIAIGIARVLGSCGRVIATDLSPVAIGVAAFNVQKYGLQTNGEEQCKYLVEYMENDVADNPPFTVKRL
ncbi:hypothetical protein C1H46_000633 [Malus baccata]|uniref:Methyltransferase domain-containing protein n=1 Tax=Malus baccata TaxID=106549 RepID=A0A540NRF2_MALBA|nr:hypothetical protein C1H46_000633 [Malus baccata]